VVAWVALEAAIDRVADVRPPSDGQERPAELHALRIAVKRLRYALELVKPALGDGYEELHGRVKTVQELLGDHHDLVVLQTRVQRRRARLEARRTGVLVQGMGPLIEHSVRERQRLFERFCDLENELGRSGLRRKVRASLGMHAVA
jgi:CHAD domain-containing protein